VAYVTTGSRISIPARWRGLAVAGLQRYGLWPMTRRAGLVLSLLGVVFLCSALVLENGFVGYDAIAYWQVDLDRLYAFTGIGDDFGAFRYSPVVAQLLDPLGTLPWPAFYASWLVVGLLALRVVARYGLALLLFLPVTLDLYFGNIGVLLGVALGLAVRWPAALALPLLTKITPGIPVLWFVARRDWRSASIAVAATGTVAAVSLLTTPGLWADWIRSLVTLGPDGYHSLPLLPRLAAAAGLAVWGGATNRAWTIVVGGWIAVPGIDVKTASMLVGVPLALRLMPRSPVRSFGVPT